MITSSEQTESRDDAAIITSAEAANHLLARSKFTSHHPKAGVNPLVDASAYLFSIVGKLKQVKSYRHLNKLHKELVAEINAFQDAAKSHGYSSEYILVSRYALCATLDDVITNTLWGTQGQWDTYSLLVTFNQETAQQERFFIILERLVKDTSLYIDLMEFMYLCLSLGFKGSYRSTEFSNNQLEQISNALYKRIRAHHGDFNKTLSPFQVKPPSAIKIQPQKKSSLGFALLVTASIILALFIGLGYLLDTISNQAYQELMHIGKSILYERHDT
jgi:type VI secretion system protein ImpK